MKTEGNILIAFILNLSFSIFEFFGGIFTGSVAIISDAVHDMADAASIGISYYLEKKSRKQPDDQYTYGYARYSVLGAMITNLILLFGSAAVIYHALERIITPTEINYSGMILFAIVGVCVNFAAALFTRGGESLNQRSVNLHMLEDVLGWVVILVGAVIMKVTNFPLLDPIMSIGVAFFILIHAIRNLKQVVDLFLEKTPKGIQTDEIRQQITEIDGVENVHHIHIWSIDGQNHSATMHIVTNADSHQIKEQIRQKLREYGIVHTTLELDGINEHCHDETCRVVLSKPADHHHHHHHHH